MSLFTFLGLAQFGAAPSGARLARIKQSPNYKNGAFHNQSITPDLTGGATYFSVIMKFFFGKSQAALPKHVIPSTYTDLKLLSPTENVFIWFGHSSYFIQVDGMRFLIDPVLSGYASPFSFTTKSFKGTDRYKVEDLPEIDVLLLTHDHYDHLDYNAIKALKNKVKRVVTGLGTGAHLELWGYEPERITELDWYEALTLSDSFTLTATPARHFSGRGFKRNQALWVSYVLQTPTKKLFLGGDSGYDFHFAAIGKKYGPFDWAIIENGQYDAFWQHIHLMPDEQLKAAQELQTKNLIPVHSGKFSLGNHAWDEPLELLIQNNESVQLPIATPMIGERLDLNATTQSFRYWWRTM